jgi:hypothetical protein
MINRFKGRLRSGGTVSPGRAIVRLFLCTIAIRPCFPGAADAGRSVPETAGAAEFTAELFAPISGNRAFAVCFHGGFMYVVTGDNDGNGRLSRITPAGALSGVAAFKGSFVGPGLDIDAAGNCFIAAGDRVIKVDPQGGVSTHFLTAGMGIKQAINLVLDPYGNILIADDIQDKVFKIDAAHRATPFIDNVLGHDSPYGLMGICFDRDFQNLYLGEGARGRILKIPIRADGQPGESGILYQNTRLGLIDNVAVSEDGRIATLPYSSLAKKLVMAVNGTVSEYPLSGIQEPIPIRFGGDGFDRNAIYTAGAAGIYRIALTNAAMGESRIVEQRFSLGQNYPNPFNPSTTISYTLSFRVHAELTVFDTLGRRVATLVDGEQGAGTRRVRFDGSNLSSGIYFYHLKAGDLDQTKRMMLVF